MGTPFVSDIALADIHEAGIIRWIEPCRMLLEHYSGLERVINELTDLPSPVVLDALRTALAAPPMRRAAILRHRLCHLPLFKYHAAAAGEMWDPLTVALEHFAGRHNNAVHVWRDQAPWPSPIDVSRWLDRWVHC